MRQVGALAAAQLEMIEPFIRPGVSTGELDRICHEYTINVQDAVPAPLNYRGFPKSICTSVNHVVCHGIPSDEKLLKEGDIINVDVTLIKDGFHGDTSKTFIVGKPSVRAKRLVEVCQESMYRGIRAVKPGPDWVTSAMRSNPLRKSNGSQSYGSTAVMVSAEPSMMSHRCCITVDPAQDSS